MDLDQLLDFFLLRDTGVRWVLLAVVLMCASSAVVGCFTFLRKRSLIGDAISHAILPGICFAFIITQTKNPFFLLIGATLSGWLGLVAIDFITSHSKIKPDTALGLILSVFYGLGILLLTMIQSSGNAAQSGLNNFLFGNAAAMLKSDIYIFSIFSVILLVTVVILFDAFKLVVFDRNYAKVKGLPVSKLELLLSLLTVFAIAIGIQAVGVVLMSALLITPAATARYWTHHLQKMIYLAILFAILSGIAGTFVSYSAPKMPTGPWIVMFLTLFVVVSVLFGSKKGVIAKWILQRKNHRQMLYENILKCLYHLGEKDEQFTQLRTAEEIQNQRFIKSDELKRGIKTLIKTGLITQNTKSNGVQLTSVGIEEGRRVTKIHRLWELYLTKYMQLPADHVHEDAEAIEHIITPELEKELEHLLNYPESDPHDSPIPYRSG